MRNAGGSARDALRSLVVSQKLLGTEEIIVVKHTDCGMLTFTNEDLYALLGEKEAEEAKAVIGDFLPFPELRKAVREDVEFLRGTGLVRNDKVSGWIYDVRTAKVERII